MRATSLTLYHRPVSLADTIAAGTEAAAIAANANIDL
jgi:hypothetical protein